MNHRQIIIFFFDPKIYHELKNGEYFHRMHAKNYITPKETIKLVRKHSLQKKNEDAYAAEINLIKSTYTKIHSNISNREIWFNQNQRMVSYTSSFILKWKFLRFRNSAEWNAIITSHFSPLQNFGWIRLFKLGFDFFRMTLFEIVYSIRENNKWPAGELCNDYSLGSEIYGDIDVDELYSEVSWRDHE